MTASAQETRLDNGLLVLTREVHTAPVATVWAWYRVGGRNEVPGYTGISHWVEHMLFKGTPTFPKGEIFRQVSRNGGILNGFTWIDFTTYFETLPADRLDLALRIEADRMVNALFDPTEVESERTVILSEREGAENHPTFHLNEEVEATAFKVHPYGHGVIGWKSDLLSITRDDLYQHYRRYYIPNNAVLVVVGDFATADLLKRIQALFGPIPAGPEPPPVRAVEPPQEGERRVLVRRPGPTRYFQVVYHAPAAAHPDAFPLAVLDVILSGAKSMGLFGGRAPMGRSSRLYRALVYSGLCSAAGSSFSLTRDPYLFEISATLRPGVDLAEVEKVVFQEIARIVEYGVAPEELERAKKQLRAQFTYAAEGVTNQAYWLGSLEMVATWRLFEEFLARLEAVQPADVQRVAAAYLTEKNRTVGWFIPEETTTGPAASPATPSVAGRPAGPFFYTPARTRLQIRRATLPNGIVVLGHENPTNPSVVLKASLRAGGLYDRDDQAGLARLTALMLTRGTERWTFEALNEETDARGLSLRTDASRHGAEVHLRALAEDLPWGLELLADVLRRPIFPHAELEKVRGEVLTLLRELDNDTRAVAERHFHELAYPPGHPYHRRLVGYPETLARLDRPDLVAFHQRYYRPEGMVIAVAGDIRFEAVVDQVARLFGDWRGEGPPPPFAIPDPPPLTTGLRREVVVPGTSQTDIALGRPALRRTDPDYYALEMANLILGRLGLMGRLGRNVRDRLGLAYYVYSELEAGLGPGPWVARAGVNPRNVLRALEAIRDEVRQIREQPVSPEELDDGKSYLTGVLPLALETNEGVARTLLMIEIYNLGLDYLDRYPEIISGITPEQVQTAAQRYLDPEACALAIAGPTPVAPA